MATPRRILPLAAALALLAAAPSWAMAPDVLFREVSPAVWQVGTTDAQGKPIATGSAVVVAPQTLVTNCHVLKGAAHVVVRRHNTSLGARLKHADTERDLCLLTAADLQATPVTIAPEPAHIGQRIYTIGAPRGLELTLSDGLVSALREEAGSGGLIQISAPISPGSSGGGLFDEDGRLLGITSMGIVGVAQNLNFARPASLIADIPARATAALQKWREAKAAATPAPSTSTPPVPALAPVPVQKPADAGTAAPAPTYAATGFAPLQDAAAIPYLGDSGREAYRKWLDLPKPRAFAIAPDGQWAGVHGTRPNYPAPSDPPARALLVCGQRARTACKLYAVDDAVVWVPQAAPATAPPAPASPPQPGTPSASVPRHIASGFAAIDDIDAIPYLSDRGRAGYREWLGKGTPRAFALAPDGHWAAAWGLRPVDPSAPTDPAERALRNCERSAGRPCRLYAVNTAVVWTREPATAATPEAGAH